MHLFFSVGEPSGDLHASKLIEDLRRRVPVFQCSGLGGPRMEQAGCKVHYRLTDLAVMGIFAVLPMLGKFLSVLWQVGKWLDADRPEAVVLVDFPGFNWWVARAAKKRGIPVIYMMPPQMWAWAGWRVHKMRRLVNLTLCGLPFEHAWYEQRGVPAALIGHPFFDEVVEKRLDDAFIENHTSTDPTRPVVAILPGSRTQEVNVNFPMQLDVMRRLHARFPQVRFLVANYKEPQRRLCEAMYAKTGTPLPVEFHVGKTSEILEASQVCLMVSGSVSLELLARRKPAVVLYGVGPINWVIGRILIGCRFISLPNLIADRLILPEFVLRTHDPQVIQQMTDHLAEWIADPSQFAKTRAELDALAKEVAQPGATQRAAQIVMNFMGWGAARSLKRAA